MVWWNAVSKTATWGVPGMIFSIASIPFRLAGLWSGANGVHSLTFSNSSLVMSTLEANFSAPCTTRWPTASMSLKFFRQPYLASVRVSRMKAMPTVWSGMAFSRITFSPFLSVNLRNESGRPTFSMPPCAITSPEVMSKSLYLMELLPQFNTNVFIILRSPCLFLVL